MNKVYYIIAGLWLLPLIANAEQVCQTATIVATTPTTRFTTNANGTVTDTKTGLMWKQCTEGLSGVGCATGTARTFTWQAILRQAQSVNTTGGFAGFTDWRVPNVNELRSIVEWQCTNPMINLSVFPNTAPAVFWSSSPIAASSSSAWVIDFHDNLSYWGAKYYEFQARLVRGGQ